MLNRTHIYLLVGMLLASSLVGAQTGPHRDLSAQLDSLEARYASAGQVSARLSRQADSLAAVIQKRKSRKSSSFLSDRALADELRRSQELANRLQLAQEAQAAQLDSLIRKSEHTLRILNDEVTRLTIQFSTAKLKGDTTEQQRLARALREASGMRERCLSLLQQAPDSAPLLEVKVDSNESPQVLAQKRDFLLDQADRMRRRATQADQKRRQLHDEASMRERLSDFVQDLRVFDPTGETPRSSDAGSKSLGTDNSGIIEAAPGRSGDYSSTARVFARGDEWPGNLTQLSDAELRRWMDRLVNQRRRWQAQADSLSQRAADIDRLRAMAKDR